MGGAKRVVVTINNPKPGNIHALEMLLQSTRVQWGTFQYEVGELGTVHLQCAIYFHDRKSLGQVAALLQGISWGCGCREHPILVQSGDDTATTIEQTPEPEEQ